MKKAKAKSRGMVAAPVTTPLPANRSMTVIAQDPDVRQANGRILMACIDVPAEALAAGPIGYRVQVVDFDSSSGEYHGTHSLPASVKQEPQAWTDGRPEIVEDYRFHAQNVYALVMKTLARFEFALGRRVGWSFDVHQIKVAPHGVMDANAFYSRDEEGLVLGHFPGREGRHVYTCLSHDVVVHETTHALLDALRERYLDPSGPDQGGFHEGFSDIVALLSVFSQVELVAELLRKPVTKARPQGYLLSSDLTAEALRKSALFGLAEQMGSEIQAVRGEALRRSAEIAADPNLLNTPEYGEPHRRGEVLVAAVMNGFIEAWTARLQREKTPGQKLQTIARVAEEGSDIAAALVTMWIRSLDYMPPVHIEFGDVLSAALTADQEVRPNDSRFALRDHMLSSFKAYGILPAPNTRSHGGVWERVQRGVLSYDRLRYESMRSDKDEVFRFLWENREVLEVPGDAYTKVLSVLPCIRTGLDGFTLHETVAQYYQVARLTPAELKTKGIDLPKEYRDALRRERQEADRRRKKSLLRAVGDSDDEDARREDEESEDPTTPVYGGGVLIFDEYGRLKYNIYNDVFGSRQTERLEYLWRVGQLHAGASGAQMPAFRLSALHRQRAINARRFPEEGW
jgi:hypothetical protein